MTRPSESAQKARDRVKLWFFRDMTDAQRIELLKLFGFQADELGTHGAQMHGLRHIFDALSTPQPMTTQGEAVDPWATLIALCEALDIDPETARSAPGKPSDVILEAARKKFTGSQP